MSARELSSFGRRLDANGLTMTWFWIACITFAKKRSDSMIIPTFHISFDTKLMRCAGKMISLTSGGLCRLAAGIFSSVINPFSTSSSSPSVSSSKRIISSAAPSLIVGKPLESRGRGGPFCGNITDTARGFIFIGEPSSCDRDRACVD